MGLEIERKYLHVNLQTLRQALVDNGAHCLGAHFECNWVFDTAMERWSQAANCCVCAVRNGRTKRAT